MESVIRLLKTLSDPTRLRLLRLLALEELTVGEIAEATSLAQSRVSNHLKILRDDHLLSERHEGAWHYYSRADVLPEQADSIWAMLEVNWSQSDFFPDDLDRLKKVVAHRKSRSQAYFERVAGEWDGIRNDLFGDSIAREILSALLPEGLVIADIGTGTGYVAELFAKRAERVIAIDSSEKMLSVARIKAGRQDHKRIDFRLGDAENPPLDANEVDVATLIMLLHHLDRPQAAIGAAARALKKGGLLILTDFVAHNEKWLQEHMEHRRLGFDRSELDEWLSESGLKSVSWVVLPGHKYASPEGRKLQVPDAFILVAKKP